MNIKTILHALAAIALLCGSTACINDIKPETAVKAADWQNVSSSDGIIEKDDLSIEFPSGTFPDGERVAISTVKKGLVGGEREVSEFYQITLPKSGTSKPSTIYIKCPEASADKMVVARTPSWNRHKGKNEYMTAAILAMFNSDKGYMKVTLPEVDPCEEENPYFSIGIIQGYTEEDTKAGEPSRFAYVSDPEDMPQTKAASYNFRYTWAMDTFSHAAFLVYSQKYSYINNFLSTNIPAAHKVLEDLKFRLPSNTIIYKIEEFPKDDNAWGFMQSSKFITSWGYIRLNAKMLYEFANSAGTDSFTTMQGQIQQTLVHETSHAVHEFSYDPRTAPVRNASGLLGDEWAMMSEAIGCWTEKFTGDRRISENTPFFCLPFTKEFWPHEKSWSTYQSHGYGMGFFIDHLASKLGNSVVAKLYQNQHDGTAKSVLEDFDKVMAGTKMATFLTDATEYREFLQDIYTGKKDNRTEIQTLVDTRKFAGSSMTLEGGVFQRGVLLHKISITKDALEKNIDYDLSINQPSGDFITFVYVRNGPADYSIVGVTSDDMPDEIPVKDIQKFGGILYFATFVNAVNSIDFNYDLNKRNGAHTNIEIEFTKPEAVPKIKSISFTGDYHEKSSYTGETGVSFFNAGWWDGVGTIKTTKSGNNYKVSATTSDDLQHLELTIEAKGKAFGDILDLKYWVLTKDVDEVFTASPLKRKSYSSESARWEATPADSEFYLKNEQKWIGITYTYVKDNSDKIEVEMTFY